MVNPEPEYRRRIREKAEENRRAAERERKEAAENACKNQIVAAIESAAQKFDRQADENTPTKKRERYWHHAEVIGLWSAAFVGVAAICISSRDSHDQRTVMAEQLTAMLADQRPWIGAPEISDIIIKKKDAKTITFTATFKLKNVGKSPALIRIDPQPFLGELGTWPLVQKEVCERSHSDIAENGWGDRFSVFPGAEFVVRDRPLHFDVASVAIAQSHSKETTNMDGFTPMIVGCINYAKIGSPELEKDIHQTGFVATIAESPNTELPTVRADIANLSGIKFVPVRVYIGGYAN